MKKYIFLILSILCASLNFSGAQSVARDHAVITYDFLESNAVIFDASYQAVLDRGTTLGYTLPSAGQQILQNQLVVDLKAAGIWSLLDVFYVFATDGSSDFATLNWITPTLYQCTKVNSPTFTANVGFNGNGVTSYVNTNFAPSSGTHLSLNNASFGFRSGSNLLSGSKNANANHRMQMQSTTGTLTTAGINSNTGTVSNTSATGFFHAYRVNSTTINVYRNGVSLGTTAVSSNTVPNRALYIGALNNDNVADSFNAGICSMAFAGAALNGLEVSFYNSWNTYFTSL